MIERVSQVLCNCKPDHHIHNLKLSIGQTPPKEGDYITDGRLSLHNCTCQIEDKHGKFYTINTIDMHFADGFYKAQTNTVMPGWRPWYQGKVSPKPLL